MATGYYNSGLWARRSPVQVRVDANNPRGSIDVRAHPNLQPFGVVHWVSVQSRQRLVVNRKASCSFDFELCLQGQLCITLTNYSKAFKDGLGSCVQQHVWLSSSECLQKSFETHPSKAFPAGIIPRWSININNKMINRPCIQRESSCESVLTTTYSHELYL